MLFISKIEIHASIIEIENASRDIAEIYEYGFLKTSKKPKNLTFLSLSTNIINRIKQYSKNPQQASGTPKNCE